MYNLHKIDNILTERLRIFMIKAINAKKFVKFLSSLAISLAVGGLSSLLTRNSSDFYKSLILPPFAPPSIVFPIVWSILYVLIGISLYLARPLKGDNTKYFVLLMTFLFFWPIIFFIFKNIGLSLIWILITLVLAIVVTIGFYKENKIAGYLLIPLDIWIAFASILNASIYFLNQ